MVAAGPLTPARRAATLAAAVALAATGCGAATEDEPEIVAQPGTVTTAPSGLTPGPYALTTEEGAVISFDLPTVPAPDDEVEQLRKDLHVEPVTYVELHIDNTEGTRAVEIDDLKVISHEGGQFPFQPAVEVLAEWDPDRSVEGGFWRADGTPLDAAEGTELDARTHELIGQYTGSVPAGAEGRELMIGDFERLPLSFDDVELSPYPNERALLPEPVGHGPVQRQYRAGAPEPAPRERVDPLPAPDAPAQPAARPAQPPAAPPAPPPAEPTAAPEPAPGPAPVYVPDCTDAADPSGPVQQAAWNAACAPVAEPLPLPTGAPAPTPSPEPTSPPPPPPPGPEPEPSPTDDDLAPAAGAPGATPSPTPSASSSPTARRTWPPPPEPVTQASPDPAGPTSSATPTPTPEPTATPSSSLPIGSYPA
ncbi:hypothetical protein [Kocuria turfanensis]|uniref:DUF4352 domain-containing protein n=1 Tax=Kocuria turfanensis TaxID=388357 RepID=A0A512I913_9MICC|nr:hypothetical protein [Kocuria turfanensis]GEO94199.1 hypothetical protein KTU01_03220 [Kocuria turfanensis]